MSRTRIKFCGITRVEDGVCAARLGVDAIGCIFHAKSPRVVSIGRASEIVKALPPFVTSVGLFVEPDPAEVRKVLDRVPLDLLQFQGSETSDFCAAFGKPWIQAIHMAPGIDWDRERTRTRGAAAVFVDTHVEGVPGGTGQTFDWNLIPDDLDKPLILAGGLSPGNVAAAIRAVRPFAVDLCSGVEASKGVKDSALMQAFVQAVGAADHER